MAPCFSLLFPLSWEECSDLLLFLESLEVPIQATALVNFQHRLNHLPGRMWAGETEGDILFSLSWSLSLTTDPFLLVSFINSSADLGAGPCGPLRASSLAWECELPLGADSEAAPLPVLLLLSPC
jgi:hypothetical protein